MGLRNRWTGFRSHSDQSSGRSTVLFAITDMKTLSRPSPWLRTTAVKRSAVVRLFCFPHAGGDATTYSSWVEEMPGYVETCLVQLPGRGSRIQEPAYRNLELLVAAMHEGLKEYLDKPWVLFGHSMGALIAFEWARLLRRLNLPHPAGLIVSGKRAPQLPQRSRIIYDLPDAEFATELQKYNGTPQSVLEDRELWSILMPIIRADFELVQTYAYRPAPPLECSIDVFGGLQDDHVSKEDLFAWKTQTTDSFSLRMFPGDHFFVDSSRKQLTAATAACVERILQRM